MARPSASSFLPVTKPSHALTQQEALANLDCMERSVRDSIRVLERDAPGLSRRQRRELDSHRRLLVLIANLRANIEFTMPGTVVH